MGLIEQQKQTNVKDRRKGDEGGKGKGEGVFNRIKGQGVVLERRSEREKRREEGEERREKRGRERMDSEGVKIQ